VKGLSNSEVQERMRLGQVNTVKHKGTKTYIGIFMSNLFTFFNVLVFTVAIFIIIIGITVDSSIFKNILFLIVVVVNILVGIIQEVKAKHTIDKLSLLSASQVKVLRESTILEISKEKIVIDDVMILKSGDQVPVDAQVISGVCSVNESVLTGESNTISKKENDTLLGGSYLTGGNVYSRVTAVGENSYAGSLAIQVKKQTRPRSELLRSLHVIIRILSLVITALTIALLLRQFSDGVLTDYEKGRAVSRTAGAIVGMIPSGMFLLTTLALASGVVNLSKHRTLVQELYSIEMLARVDTLCVDKTGTLTDGSMRVIEVIQLNSDNESQIIKDTVSSILFALGDGNETASALENYFGKEEVHKADSIIPFSSETKFSSVTLQKSEFKLGAPEFLLQKDSVELAKVNELASHGNRIIALTRKEINNGKEVDECVALIVLEDNIRADTKETLNWFAQNGIDIKVISGDNPLTISAIIKKLGLENVEIYGRAKPEDKVNIVKNLKKNGKTVAMVGDGVNDILALREADCSIAMSSGSDAARNISHLVLLDNNFSALPHVITEGRRVINNTRRTSSLFMFKVFLSIFLAIYAVIFTGGVFLFEPRNLYLLEFAIIGVPTFALALEATKGVIQGNFIKSMLYPALIAAGIAILNIAIISLVKNLSWFGIGTEEYLTLCILATTLTGFLMLVKMCLPFTRFRLIVLASVSITLFGAFFVARGLLGLSGLIGEQFLLLLIIFVISFLVLRTIHNLFLKKQTTKSS